MRRFDTRIAIAALGASAAAILISRLLLGDAPDFTVAISAGASTATGPLPYAAAAVWPIFLALGAVAGIAGGLYNRAVIGGIWLAGAIRPLSGRDPQAAAIGASVGLIGWFSPGLIGGGDAVTQRVLAGSVAVGSIPLAFAVRFLLGTATYAARTPGGLFALLLVPVAQLGLVCGAAVPGGLPRPRHRAGDVRRRRHGGVLYRRCPGADHRHRAGHRNDCRVRHLAANAGRLLCRDAGRHSAAHPAHLRHAARGRAATRAGAVAMIPRVRLTRLSPRERECGRPPPPAPRLPSNPSQTRLRSSLIYPAQSPCAWPLP